MNGVGGLEVLGRLETYCDLLIQASGDADTDIVAAALHIYSNN